MSQQTLEDVVRMLMNIPHFHKRIFVLAVLYEAGKRMDQVDVPDIVQLMITGTTEEKEGGEAEPIYFYPPNMVGHSIDGNVSMDRVEVRPIVELDEDDKPVFRGHHHSVTPDGISFLAGYLTEVAKSLGSKVLADYVNTTFVVTDIVGKAFETGAEKAIEDRS